MKTAYIGIGSNIGDPLKNCYEATKKIGQIQHSRLISCSPLYKTEPVGVKGQDWYINGAVSMATGLLARELINKLLAIEADMGRVRNERWEPRIIDLDILLFGGDIINEKDLVIPHPLMHERRFVISPMVDLAPDLIHPVLGKTMTELLLAISDDNQVLRVQEVP